MIGRLEDLVNAVERCDACGERVGSCTHTAMLGAADIGVVDATLATTAHLCPACERFTAAPCDYRGELVCVGCGTTLRIVSIDATPPRAAA